MNFSREEEGENLTSGNTGKNILSPPIKNRMKVMEQRERERELSGTEIERERETERD